MHTIQLCKVLITAITLVVTTAVFSSEKEDIETLYRDASMISIATGRSMPISQAPSVATVITAEQMESMGATSLSEALAIVPGVNVIWRPQGDYYVIRGMQSNSNFNPEVLILLDGISQNDVHLGNGRKRIFEVPWQMVDRIEIVRGPGSALYGADAMAGVINVITKKFNTTPATEVSLRGGSFDTAEARLTGKGKIGDIGSVLSAQLRTTDGHEPFIERDAQTYWDEIFGTNASLAPGTMQTWARDYNLMWDLSTDHWLLRLRTWEKTLGVAGLVGALDDRGVTKSYVHSTDLRYNDPRWSDNWGLQWDLSYHKFHIRTEGAMGYPPGAFGGAFPNGLFDDPRYSEGRLRSELAGNYTGFSSHITRIGTGVERSRVYDVGEARNFRYSPIGLPIPTGPITEVPNNLLYSKNADRTLYYLYGQDEWALKKDWALTSGIRYDHYTDFGSAVNPRIALVWTTRQDLTTKLLVGRAFRAPTFLELYAQNTPAIIGNPELKPTTITSYDLVFDYRPNRKVMTGTNLFYHDLENQIGVTNGPLGTSNYNIEGQVGYGVEWEFSWEMTERLSVRGHYTHLDAVLKETDRSPGFAPANSANIRVEWKVAPEWVFNTNTRYVADRKRAPGDNRPNIKDYTITDVTLRHKPATSIWDIGISVFNIFDEDARDPTDGQAIYYDFPLPSRVVYLTTRATWR